MQKLATKLFSYKICDKYPYYWGLQSVKTTLSENSISSIKEFHKHSDLSQITALTLILFIYKSILIKEFIFIIFEIGFQLTKIHNDVYFIMEKH